MSPPHGGDLAAGPEEGPRPSILEDAGVGRRRPSRWRQGSRGINNCGHVQRCAAAVIWYIYVHTFVTQ